MQMALWAFLLILVSVLNASAAPKIADEQKIDSYRELAVKAGLGYLPHFLTQKKMDCSAYSGTTQDECYRETLKHAELVLACPTSPERFAQAIEFDDEFAQDERFSKKVPQISSPILERFKQLSKSAKKRMTAPDPVVFSLQAYDHEMKNAHAAIDGKIYMSSGLWKTEPVLTLDEITAVLAHEISHVVLRHGMAQGCLTLEWIGTQHRMAYAQKEFFIELGGSERGQDFSRASQSMEFAADALATQILHEMKLDPKLMSQALLKLRPKSEGGFSFGSHPEFDERFKAAVEAAAKTSQDLGRGQF